MEKEFVPYELAVKLKAIRFDKPCLNCYDKLKMIASHGKNVFDYKNYNTSGYMVSRPTFSQAFRWFREPKNGSLNHLDFMYEYLKDDSMSYEEAELACLVKLIEIVELKSK
jgi:hypothetical protein